MGAAAPDVPLLDGWECEPVPPSVSGMPRVSHREATSAQRGLGDKVSEALSLVGITDESVSEWLGRPCKCPGRREKLNKLGAWVMRVLKLGHSTEEYVNEIKEMVK